MSPRNAETLTNDALNREIVVQRGIFALGVAIVPDHLVKSFRTSLDEMQGMDSTVVPYSLAKSIYDALELGVIRANIKTGGFKLFEFKRNEGALVMTKFGEMVLKKLGARLDQKSSVQRGAAPSGIIMP